MINKSKLVRKISMGAKISKSTAERVLDTLLYSVIQSLQNGEKVVLFGFGTFFVKERAVRIGRNPQTGKKITIAASKIPSFRAGKILKNAMKINN